MTERTGTESPHPLFVEAIERGAAAARQASAVMISDHESVRLSTAVLSAAEPALRRYQMLELANLVEQQMADSALTPLLVQALREVAAL